MNRYWYGVAATAAIVLFVIALFAGFAALVKLLYPLCAVLSAAAVVVFTFIILPLSAVRHLRPRLAFAALVLSMVCTVSVWMYAFLAILGYLGWFAIVVSFLFKILMPLAVIGLLAKEQWQQAGILVAVTLIAYMMRRYSVWAGKAGAGPGGFGPAGRSGGRSGGVIDTTAEVTDGPAVADQGRT